MPDKKSPGAKDPAPTPPSAPDRVIGAVQREIRLAGGRVFKDARILGVDLPKETATISDGQQVRIVALSQLPEPLREQVVAEAARRDAPRYNLYRETRPPPPPPDRVIVPSPAPAVAIGSPPTIIDRLIAQATREAADELKLHLLKSGERVSSLTTKIRKAEQVPGWPKIRISGDAAFSQWDEGIRDYRWRSEKFEVEFGIVDGGTAIKLDRVSFGGISRAADEGFAR